MIRIFEFFMGCLAAHAFLLVRHRIVTPKEWVLGFVALVLSLTALVFVGLFYQGAIVIGPADPYAKHLTLKFLCAPDSP